MWDTLSDSEKLAFFSAKTGRSLMSITLDVVHEVEQTLSQTARDAYVDYTTSECSLITYKVSDPHDPNTANLYYFNMLTLSVDIKAKMLWYALNGLRP